MITIQKNSIEQVIKKIEIKESETAVKLFVAAYCKEMFPNKRLSAKKHVHQAKERLQRKKSGRQKRH